MNNSLHERMGGYVVANQMPSATRNELPRHTITLSRDAGAGGTSVARRLAAYLDAHQPDEQAAWTIYDHNTIVEAMLESHRMPAHYADYFPEDSSSFVPDTIEDLLGVHPAAGEMVKHLSETILRLAHKGNVILVGRASNVITTLLPHVTHVRLVAPLDERVEHIKNSRGLSSEEAAGFVAKTDRGRGRFLRQNFGADVADPLGYDLTINTGRVSFEEAAVMIGEFVKRRVAESAASKAWSLATA